MKTTRYFFSTLALIAVALLLSPVQAQDAGDGRGVVRLMNLPTYGSTEMRLSSHNCADTACDVLTSLLLPSLFAVDPATGTLLTADASDRALVQSVSPELPDDEITLTLDPARLWSDGEPVTAYDVLYSLMLVNQSAYDPYYVGVRGIAGVRIIDEHTLALRFAATDAEIADLPPNVEPPTPTCDDLPRANIPILPAHAMMPAFLDFAIQQAAAGESLSLSDWWNAYVELLDTNIIEREGVTVTSGNYHVWHETPYQLIRLVPADGTGAALEVIEKPENVDGSPASMGVPALIEGEINLLLDVPMADRAAMRTLADPDLRNFQIAEVPGGTSLVVLFNLADRERPLPGIHPVTGETLDQGQHFLFHDVRVRRAFQLALDQNAIIDGALHGSAVPLAGLFPPGSWAYDPSLTPVQPNLEEAKRLLDEAGWVEGADGRHCENCGEGIPNGVPLNVTLSTDSDYYDAANTIAAQWWQLGARTYVSYENNPAQVLARQQFDTHLIALGDSPYEDADPDRTRMFTPAGDTLDVNVTSLYPLLNFTSYNNPEITDLLEQARALPGCDLGERAEIYHQVERLLQQDVPFIPVATPMEFYAAAPNVIGFAPRAGDPLWNVESWVVAQ